ncbi:MAG: 3'-5' exonuclease [Armatimonadota bacterium]
MEAFLHFRYNTVGMYDLTPHTRIVALDLETTGLSPQRHRIVEFGAVCWQDGEEIGHFQTLVHPGCPIPRSATRVHGITDAMVQDQPPIDEVLPAFCDFCRADLIVAHNASFDLGFLKMECARLGLPPLTGPTADTCALARRRLPQVPNYRLETLKAVLGIGNGQAHRALDDARDCLAIFLLCMSDLPLAPRLPIPPTFPLGEEFALLHLALQVGDSVCIEYLDTRGQTTTREVRPLQVSRNGETVVLEAYCLLRNDKRRFSLERIKRMWRPME